MALVMWFNRPRYVRSLASRSRPNITGACGVTRFIYQNGEFVEPSGPFYQWDDEKFEMQAGNGVDVYRQAMDASRVSAIYRSVSTVQPPALLSLVCIKI